MSEEKKKACDCEHEHEHGCDCECGCECEADEDVVMLVDEDGTEIPFYHIATLDHEGKEYACLQQADDEDPVVEIFELEEVEEDGDVFYNFLPIDDELYETLYKKLEDEVASMTDGECDDPECECHHHKDK